MSLWDICRYLFDYSRIPSTSSIKHSQHKLCYKDSTLDQSREVVKSSQARKASPKAPSGFFSCRFILPFLRFHLMELMPKSVLDAFRETGSQEYSTDPVVIVKYFYGSWTWYATEYEEDSQTFFWLVVWQEEEWGYFSLEELRSFTSRYGLWIERDLYFGQKKISECVDP